MLYTELFIEFQESLTEFGAASQLMGIAKAEKIRNEPNNLIEQRESTHDKCIRCLRLYSKLLNCVQKNILTP